LRKYEALEKALGIKYDSCKDYELVEGKDYTVGGVSGSGWGFQEGDKNPRWKGGLRAYYDRRNAARRTPESRVRGKKAQAARRDKNREGYNEYMREYRKKNNEKSRAYAQAYRDKDRDAYNKHMREYRASKRAA
tara:strand:- start:4277 stop:4678 length:402 start_codon:yes stop_codon:yes gene_type:complete